MNPFFLHRWLAGLLLMGASCVCATAVKAQQLTVTETVFDRQANEETFAFGADISWLSQQESWGTYYCNKAGKRADLMDILQGDFGLNAVRFRVWVNPSGGWSGKQDVIGLCKRAKARGLKIMISFHYSDTWADSGSQTIPSKWTDHSVEALEKKVYEHTYDVLKALYDLDIHPRWVAIGNETKYGMLYDVGKTKSTEGYKNFTRFINSAYQAIQDVDPSMLAVIHLPNAHDEKTARNMFDQLQKYGAKYDVIGLSAYPKWSHLDVTTDAAIKSTINTYMTTFKNLKARFKKPVMVVETGHYVDQPLDGNRFLAEFMKALITDGELGCFYWEPEAMENSGYNLGAWSSKTHQATIAMDAYQGLKHTEVKKYMTTILMAPVDTLMAKVGEEVEMQLYAKTTTKVTEVAKVEFLLNGKAVATLVPENNNSTFVYVTDTLPSGCYAFCGRVTDSQGHEQMTDTVSFWVGGATVFQEGGQGFVGCSEGETNIATQIKKYTGEGYVPASSKGSTMLSWDVDFPVAGDYTLVLRHHNEEARSVMITQEDASKILKCEASPVGRWAYASKQISVAEAGVHRVNIKGLTSRGFPDIDFMAIISPEGVAPVGYGDASAIEAIKATPSIMNSSIYDLSGRLVSRDGHLDGLRKGIYLMGGKRFLVK
ncbi:MAG: glycosyl hydrolase 53 family protein [Bacteroidaceae bacterium]|nr:glycosyl hydrolase 53 family protein [Bacteroidaceae bacterium]